MVAKGKDFVCPIVDACKENKLNDNRKRLLALAEKFGCDLYINGHEHNGKYPVGKAGTMSVVNCSTVTAQGGPASFAVFEMRDDKAVFSVYSRAVAEETPEGEVKIVDTPKKLYEREVPLKPIR